MLPDPVVNDVLLDTPVAATEKLRQPDLDLGPLLEGTVTAVSGESVDLTLDDGRQAVISRENFGLHGESPVDSLSIGDQSFGVELHREDAKSRVVLSRVWVLKKQAWDKILAKAEAKEQLSGSVVATKGKGLVVDVGLPGFLPASHLELEKVEDLASYKGKILEVDVLEADPKRDKLILSRRSRLLKQQRRKVRDHLSTFSISQICEGKVDAVTDYGVFIDLGSGVKGLVHLSELAWEHIGKPKDIYVIGDVVSAKIIDIKKSKKRVSLSIKQMKPDPLDALEIGSVSIGEVSRLVDFGAFVKIDSFEGLVHLSELTEYRIGHPSEVVAPGDEVNVKILSVDKKRRRIELSLRQAVEFFG